MLTELLTQSGAPFGAIIAEPIEHGLPTASAVVFDKPARDRLVLLEPASAPLLRRALSAEALLPWCQQREPVAYVACIPDPALLVAHPVLREALGTLPTHVSADPLSRPKLIWSHDPAAPAFSYADGGTVALGPCSWTATDDAFLLGAIASAIGRVLVRQGVPVARLPIPNAPRADQDAVAELVQELTLTARSRESLRHQMRLNLLRSFGPLGATLTPTLQSWWLLDFAGLRTALRDSLHNDIPEQRRAAWASTLAEQQQLHATATSDIRRMEATLDQLIFRLFRLSPRQIAAIEQQDAR